MKNAIAYIRVSTARQGRSGLGLEAQLTALERFALAEGYNLVQTFEEVETGKGADALDRRPQLSAALKEAKKHKAPVGAAVIPVGVSVPAVVPAAIGKQLSLPEKPITEAGLPCLVLSRAVPAFGKWNKWPSQMVVVRGFQQPIECLWAAQILRNTLDGGRLDDGWHHVKQLDEYNFAHRALLVRAPHGFDHTESSV